MAVTKRTYIDFRGKRPLMLENDQTVASVSDTAVNHTKAGFYTFETHNDGQNDDLDYHPIADSNCTNGWEIPLDAADNDGIELTFGIVDDTGSPHVFTAGTDSMEVSLKLGIPIVADYDVCAVGMRKVGAYDADIAAASDLTGGDYQDFACFNINNGDIFTVTRLNNGTATATDTTDNWANDAVKTLAVKMSTARAITFEVDGAAPTVNTNTMTADSGDHFIFFLRVTKRQAGAGDDVILDNLYVGPIRS